VKGGQGAKLVFEHVSGQGRAGVLGRRNWEGGREKGRTRGEKGALATVKRQDARGWLS